MEFYLPTKAFPKAKAAVTKALALDDNLAEAPGASSRWSLLAEIASGTESLLTHRWREMDSNL